MLRHAMSREGRNTKNAGRQSRPGLEALERREVRAGIMLGVDGVLTITATSDTQRNGATIDVDTMNTANPYDDMVKVNWWVGNAPVPTKSFPLYKQANVKGKTQWAPNVVKIVYRGNAGNDACTNHTSIDSQMFGNDGDDDLIGGSGSDWLEGGNGSDVVLGNDGADVLFASFYSDYPGTSKTLPPASQDIVHGGKGDDYLFGARNGQNTLEGGANDDHVYGANFAVNKITGGTGNDYLAGGDLAFNSITDRDGKDTIHSGTSAHTSIWTDDLHEDDTIYIGKGTVAFIVCDQPNPKGDKVTFF
ncbi:MAG: calcium-binding protein [Isosphaeraceae bacterium]